ncbi:hypothetical protein [Nocardioides sp. Kera G14]|uniref:hypothetical protein n=1 Tax=Nocardioides sp. Kera G14 TaxID=2884264 RepID=UPI001D12C2EF|nr:hypothetical protein [Nocardioides sp. Kera G14]UDY23702.1 hypothetical protein LH076_16825 [Nocardioides sp. Kera G14]
MGNAPATRGNDIDVELEQEQQRTDPRIRHASAVARLMGQREDLNGVHALADIVAEGLRWTA